MKTTEAVVTKKKRIPLVWAFPVLALSIGIWMVVSHELKKGPTITITFEDSGGVVPEKTKIKARSVEIGAVSHVELSDDYEKVLVHARIDKNYGELLRNDSRIWIVKPRLDSTGISGLGTLLSGAYIELVPGKSEKTTTAFVGLETPPIDPNVEGVRVFLESTEAYSVSIGDPVLYKGFHAGRIVDSTFDNEKDLFVHTVHIEEQFASLVTSTTRFWNTSAFEVNMGTEGISVKVSSLETFFGGGVSFEQIDFLGEGEVVEDGFEFDLYESYEAMNKQPYQYAARYVLLFKSSVRGLSVGAPVEYKGIQLGTVERILFEPPREEEGYGSSVDIPVLIRIDPGRMSFGDTPEGLDAIKLDIPKRIEAGLRARLAGASLLTGALFVEFDFSDNSDPVEDLGTFLGHPVLPTAATGINEIESRILSILEKVDSLPMVQALGEIEATFVEFRKLSEELRSGVLELEPLLNKENMAALVEGVENALLSVGRTLESWDGHSPLYFQLQDTFDEIRRAAIELEAVGNQLNTKPNSLIFSGSEHADPQPPGKNDE